MFTFYENLQTAIEKKRIQMTNIASLKGISSSETIKISEDLDKLIILSMNFGPKQKKDVN